MATGDWNYLAGRIDGDGYIDIVETELPLSIHSIDRNLSAPSAMDGSITNAVKRLKKNGQPIFEPWNTVIVAEASGLLRGMTIYRKPTFNGRVWELDQIGLSGYPLGMPYTAEMSWIDADPLDIYRHIWRHLQQQPYGNLGVTVDQLTSPVRVGTPLPVSTTTTNADGTTTTTTPTVAEGEGPRKMNFWETGDLGKVVDDYAKETPFDWTENVFWVDDRPHCHIDLGYPQIGQRDTRLRFVLGENLATEPGVTTADYVNQAYVLGAGEGRDRIRGYAGVSDGRLRRVKTLEDKSISATPQANQAALAALNGSRGQLSIDTLDVYDHPNARLTAIELGNDYPLYAEMDWITVDTFVRVVGISTDPARNDKATITVMRSVQA